MVENDSKKNPTSAPLVSMCTDKSNTTHTHTHTLSRKISCFLKTGKWISIEGHSNINSFSGEKKHIGFIRHNRAVAVDTARCMPHILSFYYSHILLARSNKIISHVPLPYES